MPGRHRFPSPVIIPEITDDTIASMGLESSLLATSHTGFVWLAEG